MRTVSYIVRTNAYDEKISNGDLVEFLLYFHKLFVGNLIPPLSVVNKVLLKNERDEICKDIIWVPFSITEEEYIEISEDLAKKHGLGFCSTASFETVDSYLDWYLLAMNRVYGVPIDSHRKREMKVRDCENRLAVAKKSSMDANTIGQIDSERFVSTMDLADFLDDYISSE